MLKQDHFIADMLLSNRKFLLLFLVMLQFFAPLLHAHAGQSRHFGFHIPGLEFCFGNPGPGNFSAIQSDHTLSNADDFIVSVNDGIQENRSLAESDMQNDCCLPLLKAMLRPVAGSIIFKGYSEPPLLPSRTRLLTRSQRAPPAI